MVNQASSAASDGAPDYHTVFIDTSLDTHLITVVSSSETVSDLKKKVLCEHALCFPHIGEIKIHGLKVKRRGKFYYLSESMLVKSLFHGVNKGWFVCVDASRLEVFDGNRNFVDPSSNNLLTPVGTMNIASDNETLAKSPRNHALLTNGGDERLQKQIDSCDQNLGSDIVGGDSAKSMDVGEKLMEENCGEANYEKENGINNIPKEGPESIVEGGIFDKPGSMPLEERAAETTPVREDNDKPKLKKKCNEFASTELNAEVPESGMCTSEKETEEPGNSLVSANVATYDGDNAIDEFRTNSFPEARKGRSTIEERVTIQSERTGEIEKVVELNNAESRENDPEIEPSARRKRKRKQENEGDKVLPKDDGPLISKSNKVVLEQSAVSQKSLVDKQHGGNAILDGLSSGTPEAVLLESASPSKKRKKKKKRSEKASNQEATVVPSAIPNEGVEHFGMHNNSNSSEKTAAVLASGQVDHNAAISEPGVPDEINQKHKQGDTDETNLRPNSLETVSKNKEVGNLEDEHEASAAAMNSKVKRKKVSKDQPAIVAEDNSCAEVQASDKKEKANDKPRHGNDSRKSHPNHFSDQNNGVQENQNHPSGQNNEEREFALEISPQIASSEKNKVSAPDDLQLKANDTVMASEPLGAGVNVDPPKSSKKRKKSKKANDLANITPSASVTEHVEAFISNTTPTEPNKEESNRLPKVGKEIDTMSSSLLGTDKEINDVIQNVVDSVQQMVNSQMGSESIHGKSKQRTKKKQKSDANLLPESTKQDENVVVNNAEQTEYPSEVTKQKLMESEKLTGDLEVSCEGSGVNFNDYFTPRKHNPETVGSLEIPVDQTTVTAKKKTKNKKRDRHSETPSSEINTPQALDDSHGVIAKPITGGSSSAEVQVSVARENTKKTVVQLNKKPSNKVNSVPEEARRSKDAKPSGIVNDSKSKRAELNLKNSKGPSLERETVNGHQSLEHQKHKDGGKAPPVKSLVGLSGSIFSDKSSSSEESDSGSSTRTPSDVSLSSDYSDGESNAVSSSWKRGEGGMQLSSEMSLHKIMRSSSRFKKAKITASQSQNEEPETEPFDFVPEKKT